MSSDWAAKAKEVARVIRAKCKACSGTGVSGTTYGPDGETPEAVECEYCGRPMREVVDAIESALRDAARVPEVNASSLLAEVLEECGIRTGTTIDRKDLENMAASLRAKLSALAQPTPARGEGE